MMCSLGTFSRSESACVMSQRLFERAHAVEIVIESGAGREADHGSGERHRASPGCSKSVAIRPCKATDWSVLEGADAIQAIHFGLKSWCVRPT